MLSSNFECVFVSHEASDFLIKELALLYVPLLAVETVDYKLPDERKPGEEVEFDMDGLLEH
jgi:hypothetical protein